MNLIILSQADSETVLCEQTTGPNGVGTNVHTIDAHRDLHLRRDS